MLLVACPSWRPLWRLCSKAKRLSLPPPQPFHGRPNGAVASATKTHVRPELHQHPGQPGAQELLSIPSALRQLKYWAALYTFRHAAWAINLQLQERIRLVVKVNVKCVDCFERVQ
ncbi:hypothetical protein LX32DRAFT_339893 [Colletotrichum zoysiae]|uniref:Uncharacterized protein n=1 Tax=Colletotrichum zoysiae TaxID=1216348 RepID=A0AAD9HT49_9PEZI|nr:hypothetical protein LX32DRAFT_339893 [Colletotrichum zoysiae]